jgi:hypothetical protein
VRVRKPGDGRGAAPIIQPLSYELAEGPSMTECPVSAITPRSFELVQIVNTLMRARESAGSAAPADRLPGHLVDALSICKTENDRADAAMTDAVHHC